MHGILNVRFKGGEIIIKRPKKLNHSANIPLLFTHNTKGFFFCLNTTTSAAN